ncbi:MAG: right-handed parallel beta-helix repeat-containing protein [Armatimonadota bacterium]
MAAKTIIVEQHKSSHNDNLVLQRAVDEAASCGGGVVEIRGGTYLMYDSLHLRSGVHIIGRDNPRLLKVPSISVPLADYLGYGHYEITVTKPNLLRVGMGVHITDDNAFGFYETVARIVDRDGNRFFIDRMLSHDYDPEQNGRVTTLFPIISGVGISDASVHGIVVDGNTEEARELNGCRGGGIYLLRCREVVIEDMTVSNYKGDAISFQQCTNIAIRLCNLTGNLGSGLHPGSGSVGYVMEHNRIERNGGCGVFYCLRTTHSICRANHISENAADGVSIGERDTEHLIERNEIANNGGHGILFRRTRFHGGDCVVLRNNVLALNCRAKPGSEIHLDSELRDIHITENSIKPRSGNSAMFVGPGCRSVAIWKNTVLDRPQAIEDITGDITAVQMRQPDTELQVGPDVLSPNCTRHLGTHPT